jgi:excisionase family DNA binding protein
MQRFWRKCKDALQIGMSPKQLPQNHPTSGSAAGFAFLSEEFPLTVREAAVYLGVSIQTVYLWVERKQIPHLRVMGRNIRFLKSDLEPFRATFKQEVGIAKTE